MRVTHPVQACPRDTGSFRELHGRTTSQSRTRGVDVTFASTQPRTRKSNGKSKTQLGLIFARGPLILTFAKVPAEKGCESDN